MDILITIRAVGATWDGWGSGGNNRQGGRGRSEEWFHYRHGVEFRKGGHECSDLPHGLVIVMPEIQQIGGYRSRGLRE